MNVADMRAAIANAMVTNDRIDSVETRVILDQIASDGVSPQELSDMRLILDETWTEMYNVKETLQLAARELDLARDNPERYARAIAWHDKASTAFYTMSNQLDGVTLIERQLKLRAR